MKKTYLTAAIGACLLSAATWAVGAPRIQFDQTVYNFGKTSLVQIVSGTFRFHNVGDALLKLETPQPSCGCTVAALKPDMLQPGEKGELAFTLHLGPAKANLEKQISIKTNDPLTPEVSLTIQVDYTPLYDLNPTTLAPSLALGVNSTEQFATLTRTDGKPLGLLRLEVSQPWITAKVEPQTRAEELSARLRIGVQRQGSPRRFNEYLHVYRAGESNAPIATFSLYGQIMGEISLSSEALYWSITDAAQTPAQRSEAMLVRRVTIRSASGRAFELKNPQSSIPGIQVELAVKEAGKVYELVARLQELPAQTVSGQVRFETSVAGQLMVEVPVIVNVFKE